MGPAESPAKATIVVVVVVVVVVVFAFDDGAVTICCCCTSGWQQSAAGAGGRGSRVAPAAEASWRPTARSLGYSHLEHIAQE